MQTSTAAADKKLHVRTWIFAALVVLTLIIGLQNLEPVRIHILFWTLAEVPKLLMLVIFFALGVVAGILWTRKPKPPK